MGQIQFLQNLSSLSIKNHKNFYRKLIPLDISDALTVYKVQGLTMSIGQIELQYMEKSYAEIYIAFSRFKKPEDVVLIEYDEKFFDFTNTSYTAKTVERETKRL